MRLSTRARYGVRAMFELAKNYGSYPVPVKKIAREQNISLAYLERILNRLGRARLVYSVKGPGGGFLLARKPEEIKIINILRVLGENVNPVFCVDEFEENQCEQAENCVVRLLWKKMGDKIKEILENTTLKDLCEWSKGGLDEFKHEFTFYR